MPAARARPPRTPLLVIVQPPNPLLLPRCVPDDNATFDSGPSKLMQLYDVGMSSLVAAEMRHLAVLAASPAFAAGPEAGPSSRAEEARVLQERATQLSDLVQSQLWNEQLGAFTNRYTNGTMSHRVSPTSFYPLLASIATDAQAERMAVEWLGDPRRFCIDVSLGTAAALSARYTLHSSFCCRCITPTTLTRSLWIELCQVEGVSSSNKQGRHADCFWGLPSISFDDEAFGEQDYWRGLVWAPNAFLVYAGMRNYDHVLTVRKARAALAEQMRGMLLEQWGRQRHVCENYSPRRDAANCTGDRFHQWGALAGFLSLGEAGDVTFPLLPKLGSIERLNRVQPREGGSSGVPSANSRSQPQTAVRESSDARHDVRHTSALGAWKDWRSRGSGWYNWNQRWLPWPFRGGKSTAAGRSGSNVRGGADSSRRRAPTTPAHLDPVSQRPGYQQAAVAHAAAKRDGQWPFAILEAVTRHALGAFGAHGIVELDLDQSSELR